MRTNLTAEGAARALYKDRVDLVVASDSLWGRAGFDARAAGRRNHDIHAVLLAHGALGFAPNWLQRSGFAAVLPVRAMIRSPGRASQVDSHWLGKLAQFLLQWSSTSKEVRTLLAAVISGPAGFDVLSRRALGLSYIAAAYPADLVLPTLERALMEGHDTADPDVLVDVAIRLGPVGYDTLTRVAESTLPSSIRVRALDALAKSASAASVLAAARGLVVDAEVGAAAADAV
ncbi:MAG: hypothetical protein AAF449_19440, partial [Myxococcota bacterium]